MDLGSLTIKDALAKRFGDEKAAQILSELETARVQELSADELQERLKSVVGQEAAEKFAFMLIVA